MELFEVIDDRAIRFGSSACAFDWPAVTCWESHSTQDEGEYRDADYAYPDETSAILGYFLDQETFRGRRVEAVTLSPLDERWEGGSLQRFDVTATYNGED